MNKKNKFLNKIGVFLGNILFPPKCMICSERLNIDITKKVEIPFCEKCRILFNRQRGERCNICYEEAENCNCMPKLLSKSNCTSLRKIVFYSAKSNMPTNKLFFKLKNNNVKTNFEYFAYLLSRLVEKDVLMSQKSKDSFVLVSIPRSRQRLSYFGFDQSKEIVKIISKNTAIPYIDCIKRNAFSHSEKKLNAKTRQNKMSNTYSVNSKVEQIKGKNVIIFDDIVTSGASMGAVSGICLKNGANMTLGLAIGETIKEKSNK